MNNSSQILAKSVKIIQPESLLKCRNLALNINENLLPQTYDAADAVNDGITSEMINTHVIPNLKEHIKQNNNKDCDDFKEKSVVTIALNLCEEIDFFHDEDNTAFVKLGPDDINKVLPVRSSEFESWLRKSMYQQFEKPISSNSMAVIISTLESKAKYSGDFRKIATRVANIDNKIFIHLCDKSNSIVEINNKNRKLINESPVEFIQKQGMQPLPIPEDGGDLELLKMHIGFNLSDQQFRLLLGWLLGALRGKPPYPILILTGEQGSGKSTLSKMLRMLIDPSIALLTHLHGGARDIAITSSSSYMMSIDNISKITQAISDFLCQISTGGSFEHRKLFTDCERIIMNLANPILINGINCIPKYPDLLERSIFIELESISNSNRKTTEEIMNSFINDYPKIIGYLYKTLSNILKELPNVNLKSKPRMADFCEFITAAEHSLGYEDGTFLKDIEENQHELGELSIDETGFIEAIKLFITSRQDNKWIGTATELLRDLESHFGRDHNYVRASDWPKSASSAGQLLARFKPVMKKSKYIIEKGRKTDKTRTRFVKIEYRDK